MSARLTRAVIASPARAAAIIEQVAAKHRVNESALLVSRWRRSVVLPKAEIVYRLKRELGWPYQMIASHLGITAGNAHKLFRRWEATLAEHSVFLPENVVPRAEHDRVVAEIEMRAQSAEAQLAEIVEGVKHAPVLAERIASDLDLKLRSAIVLAVVSNVYPRAIKEDALLDGYESVRCALNYGVREVTGEIMRANIRDLRRAFAARKWSDPIASGEEFGSRRLTTPGAVLLSDRFGSPRKSLIVAAREMAA